jgi:hypothetical protein
MPEVVVMRLELTAVHQQVPEGCATAVPMRLPGT